MPHNTFPDSTREALKAIGRRCRTIAALLISGLWPRRGFVEVEAQLDLPTREQAFIVGGTLVLLVAGAFFAAQVGILGLLTYLLVVIIVAR